MDRHPDPGLVPEPERRALEAFAVELAVAAGRLVHQERPDDLGVRRTKTSELDVVTLMDERSEALLRARIAEHRPADGILGEEEGSRTGSSGLTWVLDPIDGTVNYLYDLPGYAVSVAVVVGDPGIPGAWAPVAGAVASPTTGELFHARAGGGAWRRALRVDTHTGTDSLGPPRPLAVSEPGRELGGLLVGTGFSYDRERRVQQARVVADLLPRVRDVRRSGAAALDLCHVAAGRLDGYYESGVQAWDIAAGMLCVSEAGGLVSGLEEGSVPSPSFVLAGGRPAVDGLREALRPLLLVGPPSPPGEHPA